MAKAQPKHWIYIPYDQLSDEIGPLAGAKPGEAGILMIESRWYQRRRPYHRQRIAFQLANMRAFAKEQRDRGFTVEYIQTDLSHRGALQEFAQPVTLMEPAERELRKELEPLLESGQVTIAPHDGWLTKTEDFIKAAGKKTHYRMDAFYRRIRQTTGILMDGGKPIGGRYSLDGENREKWEGEPSAPEPPSFKPDALRKQVAQDIEQWFPQAPGRINLSAIPATKGDAKSYWEWAKRECMTHFGPYEDAMSTASTGLFHTRLSPLINIHRLLPRTVLDDALELDIPLNSLEGFVRQVIGWREFVKHIHDATDGFRRLNGGDTTTADLPGDAGFSLWAEEEWQGSESLDGLDGGALPNHFEFDLPLPPAFWGKPSGMNCLDTVVQSVWDEAWSHHITRLMVISNLATLLGYEPRALADWFWIAYEDAYDWVVEPNVLGMSTHSIGELMTTKPYIAGSSYINKMSDYCKECRFSPTTNCPVKRLYWAFLSEHEEKLSGNFRLKPILTTLGKRKEEDREKDAAVLNTCREKLARGEELVPEDFPKK